MEKTGTVRKKPPLSQFLQEVEGYRNLRQIELVQNAYDMLNLDDYLFADYEGDEGEVNLYIGYYYSAAKAYAAHSPLVCYPSQGWQIDSKPQKGKLVVGDHTVYYEEIITSLGDHKELVLYWYQARLKTNNQVYKNKIDMGYNKFKYEDEQHGFIRIAVSISENDYQKAKEDAVNFIRAFYVEFIKYVEEV